MEYLNHRTISNRFSGSITLLTRDSYIHILFYFITFDFLLTRVKNKMHKEICKLSWIQQKNFEMDIDIYLLPV